MTMDFANGPNPWEQEYQARCEMDLKAGRIVVPKPEDKRKHPRLQLEKTQTVWLHMGRVPVPVFNISVEGICYYSTVEVEIGERVFLSVANTLAIEGLVLDCTLEETDPLFMEYQYRVRAKYAPGFDGHKIYVLARDIYIYNLETYLGAAKAG